MTYQRSFDKRLRTAIVGVGRHAYRNILPTLTYLPIELVAICDPAEETARKTARQYGVERWYASTAEMYRQEELDAVLLCVSQNHHPDLACEAFAGGVNVWMEKPPATRAWQVQKMIEERGDRVCVVGFKKVFMPSAQKALEIFSLPEHGPLQSMIALYPLGKLPEDGRAVLESGKSTGWLKNGCHPLSLMIALGGPVESVAIHQGPLKGAVCLLRFENGCLGNFHLLDGANKTQPIERYIFVGNDCQLEIENSLRVSFQRGIPFDYESQTSYTSGGLDGGKVVWEPQNHLSTLENRGEFTQGIYGELSHFCDSVLAGQPAVHGTLESALEFMKVYEAGLLSNGDWVKLSEISTTPSKELR